MLDKWLPPSPDVDELLHGPGRQGDIEGALPHVHVGADLRDERNGNITSNDNIKNITNTNISILIVLIITTIIIKNVHSPTCTWGQTFWLRTTGVNTNGAVAKVINYDRLGKKVRPGTPWKINVG